MFPKCLDNLKSLDVLHLTELSIPTFKKFWWRKKSKLKKKMLKNKNKFSKKLYDPYLKEFMIFIIIIQSMKQQ